MTKELIFVLARKILRVIVLGIVLLSESAACPAAICMKSGNFFYVSYLGIIEDIQNILKLVFVTERTQ